MTKVAYEYFGPQGERWSAIKDVEAVEREIGSRFLMDFDVVKRHVTDRDGQGFTVIAFLTLEGRVWALYVID